MPLQTVAETFTDSVPAWLFTGAILVGGYMYDQSRESSERLAAVETKTKAYEADVKEIKQSIHRVESILMGDGDD